MPYLRRYSSFCSRLVKFLRMASVCAEEAGLLWAERFSASRSLAWFLAFCSSRLMERISFARSWAVCPLVPAELCTGRYFLPVSFFSSSCFSFGLAIRLSLR